jgi:serine/threonine-protein kinase RsbW
VLAHRSKIDHPLVSLHLPAELEYRDLALRTVSAACKLVGRTRPASARAAFRNQVVSAFSEAFNNVVLHAYEGARSGRLHVKVMTGADDIRIVITDRGRPFDPQKVPAPDLAELPEEGMGIFIMRSFMDVSYRPGPPNVLVLSKRFAAV